MQSTSCTMKQPGKYVIVFFQCRCWWACCMVAIILLLVQIIDWTVRYLGIERDSLNRIKGAIGGHFICIIQTCPLELVWAENLLSLLILFSRDLKLDFNSSVRGRRLRIGSAPSIIFTLDRQWICHWQKWCCEMVCAKMQMRKFMPTHYISVFKGIPRTTSSSCQLEILHT